MADVAYYKEWLLNCSRGIVPGIEPAILARTPWGEYSAMDRVYDPLLLDERVKFVTAMKEILADEKAPLSAKILMIDFAWPRSIWDIEPEVRALDGSLPQEPWDYDKNAPPPQDERDRINLRGVINKFILNREEKMRA